VTNATASKVCNSPSTTPATVLRSIAEYAHILRVIARGRSRDEAYVDDLVQDVVERALRSQTTLDPGVNPRGWLVTILHNLHIDRCRQRARRGAHAPPLEDELVATETTPEPTWARISSDDLLAAVDELGAGSGQNFRPGS